MEIEIPEFNTPDQVKEKSRVSSNGHNGQIQTQDGGGKYEKKTTLEDTQEKTMFTYINKQMN